MLIALHGPLVPGAGEAAQAGATAAERLSHDLLGAGFVFACVALGAAIAAIVWLAIRHQRALSAVEGARVMDLKEQTAETGEQLGAMEESLASAAASGERLVAAVSGLTEAIRQHDVRSAATATDLHTLTANAPEIARRIIREEMPSAVRLAAGDEATKAAIRDAVRDALPGPSTAPPERRRG